MPTYERLNAKNPSYNETRRRELRALYEGGEKLEALYPALLRKVGRETTARHAERLTEAQYRNYLGPIIDYFASMLFVSRTVSKATREEKPIEDPGEFWKLFREDCDRGGTDLDDLFKRALTDAMVGGCGWVRLRQPSKPADAIITNRLDAERLGLDACWLEHTEQSSVLDWDNGDDGRLLWAVTHKISAKRRGLGGDRKLITETWEYLTPEDVSTYAVTYESDKKPKPDDDVPIIGAPVPHGFKRVPLVCLELPSALWVANRLRSPQLAHFWALNQLAWSLRSSAFAMPVAKVESPDEFQKRVVGAGYEIVLAQKDSYEWVAPQGAHFDALDRKVTADKDEIFRIAHQMALGVENNAAAVGRSAESKASDLESTRVVLVAFSRIVRETIEYTLDLISVARGEDFTWSVEGLDDYAALDAQAFCETLKLLQETGGVPSRTFNVELNQRKAELMLPHMDETLKATVRKEIEDGTTDPVEERELEQSLALGLFDGSSGAGRPGADAAGDEPKSNGSGRRPPKRQVNAQREAGE